MAGPTDPPSGPAQRPDEPTISDPPDSQDMVGGETEVGFVSDEASGQARVPRRIGPLEMKGKLGEGGMGVVYRARHVELDKDVAVKFLSVGEEADRFLLEARTMAKLAHPGIVKIYHVDISGETPYMVMDLIEGETLSKVIRKGLVTVRRALHLAARICRIVEYAHAKEVVHRDLKPGNIMLVPDDPEWELRVMDFGLAKHHDTSLTRSGSILGTPSYMAPEQARGWRESIGPRSDVYSLGAVLYEMLTGTPPFAGESIAEIIYKVIHRDPLSPRLLNPSVDRYAEAICLKALDKSPQRRYQSAAEMAIDLEDLLAGKAIKARPIGPVRRGVRWVRRHRWSTLALFSLALLLGYLGFEAWFPAPVVLTGYPEGTQISVDLERPRALAPGERLWLRPGYHRLVLSHPERERFEADLHLRAARRQELTVRMPPAHGTLQVAVPGARVWVRRDPGGSWREVGAVTETLEVTLRNGPWQIKLARPGYRAAVFDRMISGGRTNHIDRPLAPLTAQVNLQGGPGEVAFRLVHRKSGEQRRFTSGWQGPLRTGWHDVHVSKQNYFPRKLAFHVRAEPSPAAELERNVLRVLMAQREVWRYEAGAAYRSLVSAEFTGDGCPDFAGVTEDHTLHVVEGFFGRRLWRYHLPRRASLIVTVPDLDGDRRPDLLVGVGDGELLCFSGWQADPRKVAPLWRRQVAGLVSAGAVRDADGDRVPDLLLGVRSGLLLYSGRTGERLRELVRSSGRLLAHVSADLNRDGPVDHVMLQATPRGTLVEVASGKDGRLLWRRSLPVGAPTRPAVGDITGDGVPDVVLTGQPKSDAGTLFLLDGRDGAVLNRTVIGGRITAPVVLSPGDKRQPPLLAIGSWDRCLTLIQGSGRIRWRNRQATGWIRVAAAIGDLAGDGRREVLFGSSDRMLRMVGPDGEGWRFTTQAELRARPLLRDLDWDGRKEVVACFADGTLRALRGTEPTSRGEAAGEPAARPRELVFGAPAYLDVARLHELYRPLMAYLTRRLKLPCTLRVVPYRQVIEDLSAGRCQVAVLSPLSYVLARGRVPGLVLLASHVAASRPSFRGVVIVRDDSPYWRLTDLRGKRVALVDPDSTTGALYPQAHLLSSGHDPRRFFSNVMYGGTHSKAIRLLLAGQVDATATFAEALETAAYHGVDTAHLRVIDRTEPIPYDAYVARPEIPAELTRALRDALLRLDIATPEGRRILGRSMRIDRWLPPDDRRYDGVRRVLKLLKRHGVR